MELHPKVKKAIIILAVLVIAVIIAFRFFAEPPPPPVAVPPSVQLLQSRLVGRKDGWRQWEILAQSVLQTGDLVTLTDLDEIIMFQEEEAYYSSMPRELSGIVKDILDLYEAVV